VNEHFKIFVQSIKKSNALKAFSFRPRQQWVSIDVSVAVAFHDMLSEKQNLHSLELIQKIGNLNDPPFLGQWSDALAYVAAKNLAKNETLREFTLVCHCLETEEYQDVDEAIYLHEVRKRRRIEGMTKRPVFAASSVASQLAKSMSTNTIFFLLT